jgi:D-alanyl-D-alanine carboxypeptidase
MATFGNGFRFALFKNNGRVIVKKKRTAFQWPGALAVLALVTGCESAPSADGEEPSQPDLGADLQALVDGQVQEQEILGMAMAVRSFDGTLVGAGSGTIDPAGKQAWSVDTQSAIGSVTKTFTAVVIMQLIEEGEFSLDDTIERWFPDQPRGDEITVRMLLSHTSGINTYINGAEHVEEIFAGDFASEWTPEELVAKANEGGRAGEPGSSEAHYANTNFILLGLIVEELTGNSWAQEIEARIIRPLRLRDTTFLSADGVLDSLVGGYASTEDGYRRDG